MTAGPDVLPPLRGHESVRAGLTRAVGAGRLPGSLLIHGPAGVGRQRLGLWLAQLLLCQRPDGGPCGECRSCRLVLRLEHPDLHWFFPLPRPRGAGSPDKLRAALEDARAAELQARRESPLRPTQPGEPVGLYLAQVQTIRRMAAARPATGPRQVFLIGDAERLVPQESSPEAANALLKVLEEPPEGTTFMLTATDPDALLPTIRSRLLPIRLGPLSSDEVASFLVEQRGADPSAAALAARLAQGSIGQALAFLPDGDEDAPLQAIRARARELLAAAAADSGHGRLAAAHAESPAGARGRFSDVLEQLEIWCRDLGAVAAGAEEDVINVDALEWLRELAARRPAADLAMADMIDSIEEARGLAAGNVNPQLTLFWLLRRLAGALRAEPAHTGGTHDR